MTVRLKLPLDTIFIKTSTDAEPRPGSSPGFTLMEILLAIFIFSIMVTTIFGSYGAVFHNTDALEESLASHEMAKICLNRMTADLNAIYLTQPPRYKIPGFNDPPDPYRVVGDLPYNTSIETSRLRFTSFSQVQTNRNMPPGISEVIYYVQATEEDMFVLRRADRLFPYDTFEESESDPVLCEQIKSLTFTFYDREGDDYETWNSDAEENGYATPAAIRISLEIGDELRSQRFETMVYLPVYREKIG